MELPAGTILEGRYTVVHRVKSGGMGAVYKVEDSRLANAVCALKQMHEKDDLGASADIVEYRFNEEMQVLGGLRHPGIPRVLDFFTHLKSLCIVMDFIEGENLEQVATGQGRPADFVVDVADQVLDILVYLHGQNPPVVHRDIKPANLILESHTGRIKLVDFGLARALDDEVSSQTLAGSPGYAPVEQLHGHSEPRSDLYSLAATMWFLLTGKRPRPFDRPSLKDVLPLTSPTLVMLIDRALQTDPAQRYPHAQAMREALAPLRQSAASETAILDAPVDSLATERILVADDDIVVRMLIEDLLQNEHYAVTFAEDGKEALEIALQTRPDLIISDVEMPGMDGVTLCHKLRSHRLTRDIPIILLTSSTEVSDETRGLQAGADDYVQKPIVAERLIARVQAVLRRRFTRR